MQFSRKLWIAENPGFLRSLAIVLAHSGNSWLIGLGLGLLWLFGSSEWKFISAWMLLGVLSTALAVFAIKFTVRRRRPEGQWGQIYRRTDPHSFPSGHAARAAMIAVLGILLSPAWLGWILMIWAPMVMLARVAMGLHYISDVAAGALLGIGMGAIIWWAIPSISTLF